MPAYRSAAEAEVRDAVVARIRERRPTARIIHEINVGTYGPNRMDLVAVDPVEIIAFEVKSAKDKLDRLPAQVLAMAGVAHHVVVALHEKFLIERKTNPWSAHCERDGEFFLQDLPTEFDRIRHEAWVYPERRRCLKSMTEGGFDPLAVWRFPDRKLDTALPWGGLDLLWRDELFDLCSKFRVSAGPRSTMGEMSRALRWHCHGAELTRGICAALRRRQCAEADPICDEVAA